MSKRGGLLDALHEQHGGADSYHWHREPSTTANYSNARSHLLTQKRLPWEQTARTGEDKRKAWLEEVRGVMNSQGLNWRDALKVASQQRKAKINGYQTVVERVKGSYTGRRAENVDCVNCPGKYTKPVKRDRATGDVIYRPQGHNVSRNHLSTDAAVKLLRDYYKQRSGQYIGGLKGATKAMRQDISKKRGRKPLEKRKTNVVQSPCPTKLITVTTKKGVTYQKRVVDKAHPAYAECRSNWLYRDTPGKFDMETVDYGEGHNSKAYGVYNLPKTKKSKKAKK